MRAVNEMNKNIQEDNYKDIYIYWGLHFPSLPNFQTMNPEKLFNQIKRHFIGLNQSAMDGSKPEEVRLNSRKICGFLIHVLLNDFNDYVQRDRELNKLPLSNKKQQDDLDATEPISERGFIIKDSDK